MTTIRELRLSFGAPGERDPNLIQALELPPPPSWAKHSPIGHLFTHTQQLLQQGSICWGYLVMANMVLWEPGPEPFAAASIVYSDDPFVDRFPYWLSRAADHLGLYHEEATPSPVGPLAFQEYVSIRDERRHVSHSLLSPHMTDGRIVHTDTVLIVRQHLPLGHLTGRLFPIIHMTDPDVAMVFPSAFWPTSLRKTWERT